MLSNPPPDEAAHQDGRLMHELTVVLTGTQDEHEGGVGGEHVGG